MATKDKGILSYDDTNKDQSESKTTPKLADNRSSDTDKAMEGSRAEVSGIGSRDHKHRTSKEQACRGARPKVKEPVNASLDYENGSDFSFGVDRQGKKVYSDGNKNWKRRTSDTYMEPDANDLKSPHMVFENKKYSSSRGNMSGKVEAKGKYMKECHGNQTEKEYKEDTNSDGGFKNASKNKTAETGEGAKSSSRQSRRERNDSNSKLSDSWGKQKEDSDEKQMEKKHRVQEKTHPKTKSTNIFVIICDQVTDEKRISDFLQHRMGNPKLLDFKIKAVEKPGKKQGCTLVTMVFSSSSKASVATNLLHKSNRNNESKVHCYKSKEKALGEEATPTIKRHDHMKNALDQMVEVVEDVIRKHNAKIDSQLQKKESVTDQLKKRKGVRFEVFERLTNESYALSDKLTELELQKEEFIQYLKSVYSKAKEIINHDKFERELVEMRKALGTECHRLEAALPMYARRKDILTTVKNNKVCVVLGETGSGKSTQMVQYLYQAGLAGEGLVACTQPRKIAAVSLATHVSKEMASSVGQVVGYHVGMQCKKTALTKIMFMTDHILLNESLLDRSLAKYKCIIIDEAHERSIYTDLLLGLLKQCLISRDDLRVVITSATIDPDIFVHFFGGSNNCPVLRVSGRTFPVDVVWDHDELTDDPYPQNYEKKALGKAIEIHRSEKITDGDILVFLTSALETERCLENFKNAVGTDDSVCLQLHGRLSAEEQHQVFMDTPKGKRKVVFSTNSAETSITIDGVRFVIDTGVVKEMRFDPKRNMSSLDVVSVSKSSANQRKGRAGRTSSGTCYRLYSQADYSNMKASGSPEILRIQVSQAMLKLLELSVNPLEFEYVEAPSTEAMQLAVEDLKNIGAVDNSGNITESGKWAAKLPLEPKLGMMIKHGIEMGIPIEAIVVAACCSQSGIFYRAGTQEEKKDADVKKLKFCHEGGDLLTMLNVYREWDTEPEKKKGAWCKNNSINGKSMKGVRETMNEILTVLRKEADLKLKHVFLDASSSDKKVASLVFENMKGNLAYYLGHESAGYLVVNNKKRVQIHPSSSVLSLGLQPSWVVFSKLLKTSDDFITEVTPVHQDVVREAVRQNRINVHEPSLAKWRVERIACFPVGRHVFWKFVGAMHKNRRQVQENISTVCNGTTVVVEANKMRGEVVLYCINEYGEVARDMLEENISSLPLQLMNERLEEPVANRKGESTGTRVLLGEGGIVVTILKPHQYRSLNIKEKTFVQCVLSEVELNDLLSCYGTVEQLWQANRKSNQESVFWGRVTFTDESAALEAKNDINCDEGSEFTLEPITYNSKAKSSQHGYTMKVTWCRRPAKGHCFVYVNRPEDLTRILMSRLNVDDCDVSVQQARGGKSDILIKDLKTTVTEEHIIAGLEELLDLNHGEGSHRFKVIIPRENTVFRTDEENIAKQKLGIVLSRYVQNNQFKISLVGYREKTVTVVAFVTFYDIQVANIVCEHIRNDQPTVRGYKITAHMEFKSGMHVQRYVYKVLEKDIKELEVHYRRSKSAVVDVRELKSGHFAVDIKSTNLQDLARAKVRFDEILCNQELEFGEGENIQLLFGKESRQKIIEIGKRTKTIIKLDERQMKVTVLGSVKNRATAVGQLKDILHEHGSAMEREVHLKGADNPPGLMKALFLQYGLRFCKLKTECKLTNIRINMRTHDICLSGTEQSLELALAKVKVEKENLKIKYPSVPNETDLPDCPVCFCTVEETDMCRLEVCGHAYCKPCLTLQIKTAITGNDFPVLCAKEGCEKPLVIRDFSAQIKAGKIKRPEIAAASLNAFMMKNNDKYRFCISADCQMVYKVTTTGERFDCELCHKSVCTTCHIEFHDGLTCAMYKSAKEDRDSVTRWIQEDPNNRKKCPQCGLGIEKIAGCDHMKCNCGAHICWKCLKYFSSGSACYGHLKSAHGSFV